MTPLHTLTEAADYLHVSKRTLERFIAAGYIRVIKIGRRTLISERELEAFVAARSSRRRTAA